MYRYLDNICTNKLSFFTGPVRISPRAATASAQHQYQLESSFTAVVNHDLGSTYNLMYLISTDFYKFEVEFTMGSHIFGRKNIFVE